MISFLPIREQNLGQYLFPGIPTYMIEVLAEAAREEDVLAVCESDGCILWRFCIDGDYYFSYPIRIGEEGNPDVCIEKIEAYALKENIPLAFSDVPKNEVQSLQSRYEKVKAIAIDEDETRFCVEVVSPIDFLNKVPTVKGNRIRLTRITGRDRKSYAALAEETASLYGYDLREDTPEGEKPNYLGEIEREFVSGTAISFAIRRFFRFVGEITLYGFDGKGNAEFAVRTVSKYRGRGYAGEAFDLLAEFAFSVLDLRKLTGRCKKENTPSLRLLERKMERAGEDENGNPIFILKSEKI